MEFEKKIQAWSGFEPMTSVISVQYSINWANHPAERWLLSWLDFIASKDDWKGKPQLQSLH